MSEHVLIYTTFGSEAEAMKVGESLVESKMAACVNILPSMISIYEWKDQFHNEREVVMLVKTTSLKSRDVIEEVKRLHSYETPSVLVLPVLGGNSEYLSWIEAQVR